MKTNKQAVPFGRIQEYRQPYNKARSIKYYLTTGATLEQSNPLHSMSSSVVADTLPELVAYIKANPCQVVQYERYSFTRPGKFKRTNPADMLEIFQGVGV